MRDIMIYESGNGGEINIENGIIEETSAIFNQIYLAHFGGNLEASTTGEEQEGKERFDWWGNGFLDAENQMNSNLERSLNENTITSYGRNFIERAAKEDIEYLSNMAEIETTVSIVSFDKLKIFHKINQTQVNYIWDATKNEVIEEIII
jgi:hypothetical protein